MYFEFGCNLFYHKRIPAQIELCSFWKVKLTAIDATVTISRNFFPREKNMVREFRYIVKNLGIE